MSLKNVISLWGILIEGPPRYEKMVSELLRGTSSKNGIASNPIGMVILNQIAARGQQLTIRRSSETCNAGSGTEGREDDAHPKGVHYYLGLENDPKTLRNDRFDQSKSKGTGKGAAAVIEFSLSSASCLGADPDRVLLHELVHALRKMQGLENSEPLDATYLRQYGDSEEWLAILVENVYQSANGKTDFRGGHDKSTKLMPPENTSEGFMLNNRSNRALMKGHYHTWRPVFGELSVVSAKFNPFRAYTLDPLKYGKTP